MQSHFSPATASTTANSPHRHRLPRLVTAIISGALLLLGTLGITAPVVAQPTPGPAPASTGDRTLKVGTRIVSPFVVNEGEGTAQTPPQLSGFSIELWNAIAVQIHVQSQYDVAPKVADLLANVQGKRDDLGIAAISITADRDKQFDFSQPIYDSGLQIMISQKGGGSGSSPVGSALAMMRQFFSFDMLKLLALILIMILIPAHLLWLVERNHQEGIIEDRKYGPGIIKASWWALATLGAQADEMPKSHWGRLLAIIWMFTSIIFIAYFTAAVTTSLTVQQLQGNIRGPEDLPGKKVATTRGSTSATYLRAHQIKTNEFDTIDEACTALVEGKADAVVFDAPVLLYYSAHAGKDRTQVVGPIFRKEAYGIVFPPNSPWRKPVNLALLTLKENGTYDTIHDKWFGSGDGDDSK